MSGPRFTSELTLRSLGAIEHVAGEADGTPVVAVVSDASVAEAVARAHGRIVHPRVPRLAGYTEVGGRPAVLLAFEAVTDLEALLEHARVHRREVRPGAAAAFVVETLAMLLAAHASGEHMGVFCAANVLVGPGGEMAFVGFGHPVHPKDRALKLPRASRAFAAPEIAFGGPASAGGDLAAAALFFQSFLELGDLPPSIAEATMGRGDLTAHVVELMRLSNAISPAERSVPQYLERVRTVLAIAGIEASDADLAAELHDMLEASGSHLVIAHEAQRFRIGTRTVELEHHSTLRRVLLALARRRIDKPGAPSTWEELFAEAWPGERALPAAAKARVQVAVSTLRKLGLREALVTRDDGYLVDPRIVVTLETHRAAG